MTWCPIRGNRSRSGTCSRIDDVIDKFVHFWECMDLGNRSHSGVYSRIDYFMEVCVYHVD